MYYVASDYNYNALDISEACVAIVALFVGVYQVETTTSNGS